MIKRNIQEIGLGFLLGLLHMGQHILHRVFETMNWKTNIFICLSTIIIMLSRPICIIACTSTNLRLHDFQSTSLIAWIVSPYNFGFGSLPLPFPFISSSTHLDERHMYYLIDKGQDYIALTSIITIIK